MSVSVSQGQSPPDIKPLEIGDIVPDIVFNNVINYKKSSARLSDFKGKVVILDFWATWCGACIKGFPKIQALQEFNDGVQFILVSTPKTRDSLSKIKTFIQKYKKNNPGFSIPVAGDAGILENYFSYHTIPHYVWLSEDREVKAITSSREVTQENLSLILNDIPLNLPPKTDVFRNKPITINSIDDIDYYTLFRKGQWGGLSRENMFRISVTAKGETNVKGLVMANMPIVTMYKTIVSKIYAENFANSTKRIVLDVMDSSKLIAPAEKGGLEQWEKDNLYTYDLVMPAENSSIQSIYHQALIDINKLSDYTGMLERRKTRCLMLISKAENEKTALKPAHPALQRSDIAAPLQHLNSVDHLISILDNKNFCKIPVVNGTGYSGAIDIQLPRRLTSLEQVRLALGRYQLDLVEVSAQIDMFVIHEKTKTNQL